MVKTGYKHIDLCGLSINGGPVNLGGGWMINKYKKELVAGLEDQSVPEMGMDDRFDFLCRDECMGRCCNKITILLDPWDVETMARYLSMTGQDFIKEYCAYEVDFKAGWPFVWLADAENGPCAFLLSDGRCRVYPARSRNCRTYPLGRAVRVESDGANYKLTGKIFTVERQKFCLGHKGGRPWTVREWFSDANAFYYYMLSDLYIELIYYVTTELQSKAWMSDGMAKFMAPFLFGPEVLRTKLGITEEEIGHEEFYRRRLKALREVLTDLAAGFGFGPGEPGFADKKQGAASVMEKVKNILISSNSSDFS